MLFLLPETLQGYSENIVCETAQGSFNYEISNDTFDLPSEVLTGSTLDLQLILRDGDKVIWKSVPYTFTLNPTLDDSGENIVVKAKEEQRETDRTELAGVVTELTGEDLSAAEWNELLNATAELPIKTEQDVVDLRNCTDLKYAFERCTTLPSILVDKFNLETDEETAEKIYIRLPYLNTKNMVFNIWSSDHAVLRISKSIVECGFDVSACKTISKEQVSPFVNANYLQRTKLTGIRSLDRMWYMFYNSIGLVEIELGDSGTAPEALNSLYWQAAFSGCRNLQAITGDPLDMSRGKTYGGMFDKCESLRYVRFKAGTICHELNLSYCALIIKGEYGSTEDNAGTIISILNGIRDYVDSGTTPSFKISFSNSIKSYFNKWKVLYNNETKLWEYSEDLGATTLESAFSGTKDSAVSIPNGKGVELAWVT